LRNEKGILTFNLGKYEEKVKKRLDFWERQGFSLRLWKKDPTLWFSEYQPEITDRLGWLDLPEKMRAKASEITSWAGQVRKDGITHVVLLGMGGSSLAAEVFQKTFGPAPGFPGLLVLDSTHVLAIQTVEKKLDLSHTLFIVSSKSGKTLETISLFRYFWDKVKENKEIPGRSFIAISDKGSPLIRMAHERNFRKTFLPASDVGGRFSAFTEFGLVPAALLGMNIHGLIDKGRLAAEKSGASIPIKQNPGLILGAALGELAQFRDKLTILTSPSLSGFSAWMEQLIAESTGKTGKGIVPIVAEPLFLPETYSRDRIFVALKLDEERDDDLEKHLLALEALGHPTIRIHLHEKLDLGLEIFRWELATAAAGSVLGIHPFNQPDVQLAKDLARRAMEKKKRDKEGVKGVEEAIPIDENKKLVSGLKTWFSSARPGDYVSLQAYLAPSQETTQSLENLRFLLTSHTRLPTTAGYGPRFLHSTGQLHKGGPNTALVLQLVDEPREDLSIPETDYSFASLIQAQALGDYYALLQRERRVLRVNIKDPTQGLRQLKNYILNVLKAISPSS
jgi:transaldolase/glucose-6-phosphate isomerase